MHFICEKGHSFLREPRTFTRNKSKTFFCPICLEENKKMFFKENPTLLKYWDHEKNNEKYNIIESNSHKKYFFLCNKGHSFLRKIKDLNGVSRLRCSICSGVDVITDNRLDLKFPNLLTEWDYKKNNKEKKFPDKIAYNSNKKVHWICSEGHTWIQSVSVRTGTRYTNKNPSKCPHCYQSSVSSQELILYSELHQFFQSVFSSKKLYGKEVDIFIEDFNLGIEYDGSYWHQEKSIIDKQKNNILNQNGIALIRIRENPLKKISNDDFSYDTSTDLFLAIEWILIYILKNYSLESILKNKIKEYLNNKKRTNYLFFEKIIGKNKVNKITNKQLFIEYSKENKTPLNYFGASSNYKAKWICSICNNRWETTINHRVRGSGCPSCSNQKLKENILEYKYPLLKKENVNKIDLSNLEIYNNKDLIIWSCYKCNHEWEAYPRTRITKSNRCPSCGFHILFQQNTIKNQSLAKLWSHTNGNLKLENLHEDYNYKVDWLCDKGHITKEKIKNKLKKPDCPKCLNDSFIGDIPWLLKEWNYSKNINLDPNKIKIGSQKKVWWQCPNGSDHQWKSLINRRVYDKCPYCANKPSFLSYTNRLDINYPDISKEWDYKLNEDKPENYHFKSRKIKNWKCSNCGHLFKKAIVKKVNNVYSCKKCKKKNT